MHNACLCSHGKMEVHASPGCHRPVDTQGGAASAERPGHRHHCTMYVPLMCSTTLPLPSGIAYRSDVRSDTTFLAQHCVPLCLLTCVRSGFPPEEAVLVPLRTWRTYAPHASLPLFGEREGKGEDGREVRHQAGRDGRVLFLLPVGCSTSSCSTERSREGGGREASFTSGSVRSPFTRSFARSVLLQ